MILLIDNYDSFTYNLYQYLGEHDRDIKVIRNDETDVAGIERINPDRIVISPGPKTPDEAGVCVDVVKALGGKVPILGICLGHQCIGRAYGGRVSYSKRLMHGKQSFMIHMGDTLFSGVPEVFRAARYHSLSIHDEEFPQELTVTARARDDGEIMAVRHKKYPVFGLQFHPESIYTEVGRQVLKNFLSVR
jgi:anthranilate synthase component 2